jgi:hypothetical protein
MATFRVLVFGQALDPGEPPGVLLVYLKTEAALNIVQFFAQMTGRWRPFKKTVKFRKFAYIIKTSTRLT